MFGRLTRIGHLKAIEEIASDVRLARITVVSREPSWIDSDSYECLFRLSGTPVELQVGGPIFIENGETVRVVGRYNRNGVFEASAYYNRSSGVSSKSEWGWPQKLFVIGATVVGVVIAFLGPFLVFTIPKYRDLSFVDFLFGALTISIGLVIVFVIWIIFMRERNEIRTIDRLLKDSKPFQP